MTFTLAPLRWHILQTTTGAEWATIMWLLNSGTAAEVVFPYVLKSGGRTHSLLPQGVAKALYPSYVIVGLDQSKSVHDCLQFSRAKTFLRTGGDLVRLTEPQIKSLKQQAEKARDMTLKTTRPEKIWRPGDTVPCPIGVMAGVPVLIERVDAGVDKKGGMVYGSIGQLQISWPATTQPYDIARSA